MPHEGNDLYKGIQVRERDLKAMLLKHKVFLTKHQEM